MGERPAVAVLMERAGPFNDDERAAIEEAVPAWVEANSSASSQGDGAYRGESADSILGRHGISIGYHREGVRYVVVETAVRKAALAILGTKKDGKRKTPSGKWAGRKLPADFDDRVAELLPTTECREIAVKLDVSPVTIYRARARIHAHAAACA